MSGVINGCGLIEEVAMTGNYELELMLAHRERIKRLSEAGLRAAEGANKKNPTPDPTLKKHVILRPAKRTPLSNSARIKKEVAEAHEMSVDYMCAPHRLRECVLARRELFYRLVKELNVSLSVAGRLGGINGHAYDHTTVLNAVRQFEKHGREQYTPTRKIGRRLSREGRQNG
jgi:chromosomal replication initiation ATPase DnaA